MFKENLNPDIQAKINSLLQGETMGQAMLQVFNLIIDVITSLDKDKLDLECEAENYETGDTKSYRLVFTLTDPERPERVKNDT
jgi:SHS2 domain-containing protein